jgi:TonB family protein
VRTTLVALLTLLLAPAAPAHAQEPAASGVLTRAPAVLEPVEPVYPDPARAEGATGAVTLELAISATGEVTDAVVIDPAGHGFDEAALAAARALRFTPAEIDGAPAEVRIEYRFTFSLAPPPEAAPPPVNLRGRVLERGTRVPVVAARVEAGAKTTFTDRDGRFALAGLPDGPVSVVVTDVAHARFESIERIEPGKATELDLWVRKTLLGAYEAVVVGAKEKEVAHVALTVAEVQRVPGVSGDAVKVIQNLPGVARPPAFSGELVVRGGNPRDTRVYVDGNLVPQVFHFGGLTSVYSSDLVKDVEFEAGNFGVRYGRAIGGRVNLVSRDPGERTHAIADVNLYQATALYEDRLSDDLGVAFAVRRSYADAIVTRVAESADAGPRVSVAPRYYDLQAKTAWKASAEDTVRFDFYGSDDRMVFAGVDAGGLRDLSVIDFGTRFYQGGVRWDRRASERTRLHLALSGGWQDVGVQIGDVFSEHDDLWRTTARAELHQVLAPWAKLVTGVDVEWVPRARIVVSAPSIPAAGQVPSPTDEQRKYAKTIGGGEAGAFVEATLEPLPGLFVVPGLRADVHHELKDLAWIDPRVAARWQLGKATAIKGAVGLYHQAPPLVYMTEEWGNPAGVTEEGAWQYSVGAEQRLFQRLSIDVQLYYKRLFDLVLPSSGTVVRDGQVVPERFRSAGTGRAYGAELLLRWDPDGRFFGWIAYSLSRTRRDQSVAGGDFNGPGGDAYDQPHNLVAVGSVELPELWEGLSAGFRLRYTSGAPYEPIGAAVYDADADAYAPFQTGRRSGRMPDFFQLDLRVDKKWTAKTWCFTAYAEVQNVSNRQNAESVAYNFDYTRRGWMTGLPLFPAFGLRAEY